MKITTHAEKRMQQRGIPPLILEWLFDYGATNHDHHGAIVKYFDKTARRAVEKAAGRQVVKRLSDFLDCYAVVRDDILITTGKRYKHVRRH